MADDSPARAFNIACYAIGLGVIGAAAGAWLGRQVHGEGAADLTNALIGAVVGGVLPAIALTVIGKNENVMASPVSGSPEPRVIYVKRGGMGCTGCLIVILLTIIVVLIIGIPTLLLLLGALFGM